MKVTKLIVLGIIILSLIGVGYFRSGKNIKEIITQDMNLNEGGPLLSPHPLSIAALKQGEYPGSEIVIEQTLPPSANYQSYIASYKSDGLKIYALLTIPNGPIPNDGFPVIIFNHGYIPPGEYRTTERYLSYTDVFSRNGYILLKPDYRGHGNSEGEASGGYGSNGYTIDVLNAVSSIKRLTDPNNSDNPKPLVEPNKIGMWGHSMGGHITLENMVVSSDVKAGVIWAGVVGSYEDLFERWRRSPNPSATPSSRGRWRQALSEQYGTPDTNPEFWKSLSATSYLSDISGPLQLHHGTSDPSVPVEFTQKLESQMKEAGKRVETFYYEGDDHNLSANLILALERSLEFFDKYLKS